MKRRKWMVVAAALLALLVTVSAVGAQPERPPAGERGEGRGGLGAGLNLLRNAAQVIIDETGLTMRELRQAMQGGASLAQIITDNGGDVSAVSASILADVTSMINQAVANGRITQARADAFLANLPTQIDALLNSTRGDRPDRPNNRGGVIRQAVDLLGLASDMTGIPLTDIVQQIRAGGSLGSILTTAGVDHQAFVDAASADMAARLDQAVASGRITQARADQQLAQFQQRLLNWLARGDAVRQEQAVL